MIEYRTGNLLDCEADALVNTVNCVGVMGRGIALQFKKAFPENFKAYRRACEREEVRIGEMFVFETGRLVQPRYIVNFPTKRHWRGKSRIEDIEAGLEALVAVVRERKIRSIAIPPLGSGLGGLPWPEVRRRIVAAMGPLEGVRVIVYEPLDAPMPESKEPTRRVPRMTAGRATLVTLIHRYLDGLLDPSVTLLEIHKLMYFAQEAGESLRLRFRKAYYGPYAENLGRVLHAIEGYMTVGYDDAGDRPDKEIRLVPGVHERAARFLASKPHRATHERLERVADLIEGFESPFGLELLSSVHWLLRHEGIPRERLVDAMHSWNERKRRFTPRQIGLTADRLRHLGWLPEPQHRGVANAPP